MPPEALALAILSNLPQLIDADYRRTTDAWPMVGFIFMVDEFRRDNGATRFVPGSHRWHHAPSDVMPDATADYEGPVTACGPPRLSRHLQRFRVARTRGQPDEGAAAFD